MMLNFVRNYFTVVLQCGYRRLDGQKQYQRRELNLSMGSEGLKNKNCLRRRITWLCQAASYHRKKLGLRIYWSQLKLLLDVLGGPCGRPQLLGPMVLLPQGLAGSCWSGCGPAASPLNFLRAAMPWKPLTAVSDGSWGNRRSVW